jgi:hypothetical protein
MRKKYGFQIYQVMPLSANERQTCPEEWGETASTVRVFDAELVDLDHAAVVPFSGGIWDRELRWRGARRLATTQPQ